MTVVFFCGAGGLLLLMQPDRRQAITAMLDTIFIVKLLITV